MRLRFLAPAATLFLATGIAAHADIITALQAGSGVHTANGYQYTYNVELGGGSQLDPVSNGAPVQFGTVYDFGTILTVAGATYTATGLLANPNLFTFSFSNTNTAAKLTAPVDDPTLTNIRFTYIGSTGYVVAGSASTPTNMGYMQIPDNNMNDLGTFTVYSPYAVNPTAGATNYDGQSYKAANNTVQGNVGYLDTPLATAATPEPSSFVLLGTGMLGLAGVMRRRLRA